MAFSLQHPLCSFLLLLLLLLPFSINAQTNPRNITLGSSLKAAKDSSPWVSPSGDFAFGFQAIQNDGFLLAIWFDKLPEKTIVWSANRNNLVQIGSVAQLTTDGQLVLRDQSGLQVWSANPVQGRVSYAALLNTGNFVLADNNSAISWQSFDHPTDTILPTQTLNKQGTLISRYSATNYSDGRFMFIMQGDGNLVMYTTNYPLTSNNFAYMSNQSALGYGYQVIFNQSGYIYLTAENRSILFFVTSNAASTQDLYQRAIIDSDGVFRQYVYPKKVASGGAWPSAWSTLSHTPSDICLAITADTGSGACGFNSFCSLKDGQTPICLCPQGYDFIDPNDVQKGCKLNFAAQLCDDASGETDLFEIVELPNTDWPLSDYEHYYPVSEDWCRQACLNDCYCAVAIIRNEDCWKKKLPLSNGRVDSSVGGKALIKVRKDNSSASDSQSKDHSTLIITGSVLLGSSVFLNFLLLVATYACFLRFNKRKRGEVKSCHAVPGTNAPCFTYNELEAATGGFKEEVGRGGFGTVYKGILPHDSRVVAVKKLDRMEREGEVEFRTEVSVIGGTNHRNLVRLLGFCNEGQHRLLVYEFMSNGSLANFLFGDSKPNWYTRIQIACGIARGLFYLHEECSSQIIHCDIKPQNILLDESLTARISDFGLAKFMKVDQTRTTTKIRGTKGYVAPEWFRNLPITVKVDVYSFGILLLELVCCRRNVEPDKMEDQVILTDWVYDCYKDEKLHLLVEGDEVAMDDLKRVIRIVMVALWCIQEDPSLRPAMKKVVQMLEGSVHVAAPPDSSSFISSI